MAFAAKRTEPVAGHARDGSGRSARLDARRPMKANPRRRHRPPDLRRRSPPARLPGRIIPAVLGTARPRPRDRRTGPGDRGALPTTTSNGRRRTRPRQRTTPLPPPPSTTGTSGAREGREVGRAPASRPPGGSGHSGHARDDGPGPDRVRNGPTRRSDVEVGAREIRGARPGRGPARRRRVRLGDGPERCVHRRPSRRVELRDGVTGTAARGRPGDDADPDDRPGGRGLGPSTTSASSTRPCRVRRHAQAGQARRQRDPRGLAHRRPRRRPTRGAAALAATSAVRTPTRCRCR